MSRVAAEWIVAMAWQLALLGAIVWLVDRLLPRRIWPGLRTALWSIVLLKALLPPTLSSPVSLARLWAFVTASVGAGDTAVAGSSAGVGVGVGVGVGETGALAASQTAWTEAGTGSGAGAFGVFDALSSARPTPDLLERLSFAIVALWLAGMAMTAIAIVWRYRRARRTWLGSGVRVGGGAGNASAGDASADARPIRRARPDSEPRCVDTAVADALKRAAERLDRSLGRSRARPALQVSHDPRIDGAAVVGFFSPVIVVSASIARRPDALHHVLLHELAHVERRDPLVHLACLVLQAIYWFHPIVWMARARLATQRELACDRLVTRALGGDAAGYRRTLLTLARPLVGTPAPAGLAFLAGRSQLVARLEALAHPAVERSPRMHALTAIACGALLASCVPLHHDTAAASHPAGPEPEGSAAAPIIAASGTSRPDESSDGRPFGADVMPDLRELRGSLQVRYTVLRAMAAQEAARASRPPPNENDH